MVDPNVLGPSGHHHVQHGCQALGPCYFPAVSDKITNTENVHALSTGGKVFDYKVSHFHRVIPGFICQGGDFTCHDGTGSKSNQGQKFDDKNFILKHTDPEILPMQMLDSTQMDPRFSCVQTKTEWLDRGHTYGFGTARRASMLGMLWSFRSRKGKCRKVTIADCGQI